MIAESTIESARQGDVGTPLAYGHIHRGLALIAQGDPTGIAEICEGVTILEERGEAQPRLTGLSYLAEAYLAMGRIHEGLAAADDAFSSLKTMEACLCEAELHRVKGELLLRKDRASCDEACECFERAISIARAQSAKSWELRATTSLARLLAKQGRRDEARTRLAEIYDWFTEGFDTADLKDAKALLGQLDQDY